MNANRHPLSRLTSAEATLISSIDAATARLDAVGTSALDAALERLRNAAQSATARMADAGAIVAALAGDVLESVLGEAEGIEGGVMGIPATEPAQVQPAIEVEPAPRRTGFALADAFLDVAREAEAEATAQPQPVEPQTPREKYPSAPAFTPDGPTLFDEAGNESDPTAVLLSANAVPYVASAPLSRPGSNGDAGAGHAVASPQKRRKGR